MGLGVRQAPIRIAVVLLQAVGAAVESHRLVDVAGRLDNMPQRHRVQMIARLRLHEQAVVLDRLGAAPHAVAGGGVQRSRHRHVGGIVVEQALGLFQRLGELLGAQQHVGVLDARVAVRRRELEAALEQELGLVEDAVAGGDFGQQTHALDVGLVVAQEVLAQALGVEQPVFRQVAGDGEQLRRQGLEKGDLLLRGVQLGAVPAFAGARVLLVELGQALPAVDEGGVGRDRLFEGRGGFREITHRNVVVADLLMGASDHSAAVEHLPQAVDGKRPLVLMPLRHRQRVARLGVGGVLAQQQQQRTLGVSRRTVAQQVLGGKDRVLGHALFDMARPRPIDAGGGNGKAPRRCCGAALGRRRFAVSGSRRRGADRPCAAAARSPPACSGRRSASSGPLRP